MKWKYAVSLTIVLVAAAFAAAAMAQRPGPESREATKSPESASDYVQDLLRRSSNSPFSLTWSGGNDGQSLGGLFRTEDAALATEVGTLIRKLEAADSDTARSDIKAKLSATLGKQFDLRQKRHEQEIKALEAKVKKLKELVIKRQESREEIVSRRLEEILRESQGLGW